MTKTEKAIRQMETWARDDSHGYDQRYRWGEKGDFDCSAAVIQAWQNAGVPVRSRGATYTGDMLPVFRNCGFKDVTASVNRFTGAGLKRGDVLLNTIHHTAMYCGNGLEVEASVNEKGTATGGQPGDQTGKEFLIRSYRNYLWTNILRYQEKVTDRQNPTGGKSIQELAEEVLNGIGGNGEERKNALENAGYNYNKVQNAINALLSESAAGDLTEAAEAVIDGKYGNGQERIDRLKTTGHDPATVQKKVNELLQRIAV